MEGRRAPRGHGESGHVTQRPGSFETDGIGLVLLTEDYTASPSRPLMVKVWQICQTLSTAGDHPGSLNPARSDRPGDQVNTDFPAGVRPG